MPFVYNLKTNDITMPAGDTGGFEVQIDWATLAAGDVVLFAIFDPAANGDLVCKHVPIEDGSAYIRLCNEDTRALDAGCYKWNLRIVTSPVYDPDGNVRVDECSDDVITVFNKPPTIQLIRGGAHV